MYIQLLANSTSLLASVHWDFRVYIYLEILCISCAYPVYLISNLQADSMNYFFLPSLVYVSMPCPSVCIFYQVFYLPIGFPALPQPDVSTPPPSFTEALERRVQSQKTLPLKISFSQKENLSSRKEHLTLKGSVAVYI